MPAAKSKTVISIFLIVSLIAPFVATYTWLRFEKHQTKRSIKWRMIEGMQREELELLKFSKEEAKTKLEWEHSKEFEYNHQMYDVVETVDKGDSIFYWCWWDNEETALNKQLDQLAAIALGGDPQHHKNQHRWIDFLKSLYWEGSEGDNRLAESGKKRLSIHFFTNYSSLPLTLISPPPEWV